jgi:hypothetical protein
VICVGDGWAEDHHDVELVDEGTDAGRHARLPEGLEGIARLHELIAAQMPASLAELAGRVSRAALTERRSGTRRDPPVGVLRHARQPRRPHLLPSPPAARRRPPGRATPTRQPLVRHPAQLPQDRHQLQRDHRMGPPTTNPLAKGPGMSAAGRVVVPKGAGPGPITCASWRRPSTAAASCSRSFARAATTCCSTVARPPSATSGSMVPAMPGVPNLANWCTSRAM